MRRACRRGRASGAVQESPPPSSGRHTSQPAQRGPAQRRLLQQLPQRLGERRVFRRDKRFERREPLGGRGLRVEHLFPHVRQRAGTAEDERELLHEFLHLRAAARGQLGRKRVPARRSLHAAPALEAVGQALEDVELHLCVIRGLEHLHENGQRVIGLRADRGERQTGGEHEEA